MIHKNVPDKHPSYGCISVSRVSSTGTTLFRSPFVHRNYISVRIKGAFLNFDSGTERHYPDWDKNIVEIALSETQWSQLLSSHSIGEGIPCTFIYVGKDRVEECPIDEFRKRFENEFEEKAKSLLDIVNHADKEITSIMNQPTIKVADRAKVKELTSKIVREFALNLPFIMNMYVEKMREVTDSAENEIRAGLLSKIQAIGLEEVAKQHGIVFDSPIEINMIEDKAP